MKNKTLIYYLIFLFLLGLHSCKEDGEYHSVKDKIEHEGKPYHGKLTSDQLLTDSELIEITEGEHTFLIPERKGQIKSFACTECHTRPIKEMEGADGQKAHWDLTLNHAKGEMMNCTTCHNGENMNNLIS
jgi:hypothetical protein